jgi:hypothetical protein
VEAPFRLSESRMMISTSLFPNPGPPRRERAGKTRFCRVTGPPTGEAGVIGVTMLGNRQMEWIETRQDVRPLLSEPAWAMDDSGRTSQDRAKLARLVSHHAATQRLCIATTFSRTFNHPLSSVYTINSTASTLRTSILQSSARLQPDLACLWGS